MDFMPENYGLENTALHTQARSRVQQGVAILMHSLGVTSAVIETMALLTDVDQCSMLLASMEEARRGQCVSMQDAFADLAD